MKQQKNIENTLTPKHIAVALAVAFAALSGNVLASGYQFGSQTVSGQGNSDAGSAEADNASTIFYNPAGMSLLKGDNLTIGTTIVVPQLGSIVALIGSANMLANSASA